MINDGDIITELACGAGMNLKTLMKFKPSKVELVDISLEALDEAYKSFGDLIDLELFNHSITEFAVKNLYKGYKYNKVAFGLCALSYCDKNGVDQILHWAKTSVKTLILAEVTDVEEGREKFWDSNQ